jgi:methionyl-tRNA formyltransferase
MFIKMKTGWIEVLEIQAEGKKRLPIDAFLRGFDVNKLTQIDEAP